VVIFLPSRRVHLKFDEYLKEHGNILMKIIEPIVRDLEEKID